MSTRFDLLGYATSRPNKQSTKQSQCLLKLVSVRCIFSMISEFIRSKINVLLDVQIWYQRTYLDKEVGRQIWVGLLFLVYSFQMMVITNGSALITTCTIFEYFHFHKQYLKYLWQNLNYFTRVIISIFKQCYNPITCFEFFGILWSCCTWAWVESLGFPVQWSYQVSQSH